MPRERLAGRNLAVCIRHFADQSPVIPKPEAAPPYLRHARKRGCQPTHQERTRCRCSDAHHTTRRAELCTGSFAHQPDARHLELGSLRLCPRVGSVGDHLQRPHPHHGHHHHLRAPLLGSTGLVLLGGRQPRFQRHARAQCTHLHDSRLRLRLPDRKLPRSGDPCACT